MNWRDACRLHMTRPFEFPDVFGHSVWGRGILPYTFVLATILATVWVLRNLEPPFDLLSVGLVFLLVTFLLALLLGPGPAVVAALLSFLVINYFFTPPFHTFAVADREHVLALAVYLGIATVTGRLVARARARTDAAILEQRRIALLYELNAALIGDVTLDAILMTMVEKVVQVYRALECRILIPEGSSMIVRARYPLSSSDEVDRQTLAMATWVRTNETLARQVVGHGRLRFPQRGKRTSRPGTSRRTVLFLPIATAERTIGVLEVRRAGHERFAEPDIQLLTAFANQAALALERAQLTEEAGRVAILEQSDRLKSALLSAVSHELRTPLATIKASVTSLLDESVSWDVHARTEFLQAVDEETDRLARTVGNLLDLSRIEGGALRPDRDWYDVTELVLDVASRLSSIAGEHRIEVDLEPDLPLACIDYVQIAQVLMNLGENAIKYTPPGTEVTLSARHHDGMLHIAVHDAGPGIPAGELERLFEKFYRARHAGHVSGVGIGLTISKGLVEAHGGRIWAESREGSGTTFHLTLPRVEEGAIS